MKYLPLLLIVLLAGCGDSRIRELGYDEGFEAGYQEGLAAPLEERTFSHFDMWNAIEKHFGHRDPDPTGKHAYIQRDNIGSSGSTGCVMTIDLAPGGMHYNHVVQELAKFEKTLTATNRGDWMFRVESPEHAINERQERVDRLLESIRKLKATHDL